MLIYFRTWPRLAKTVTEIGYKTNRRQFAYVTSAATRTEPRTGVTAVLLLHHGEPTTIEEALEYRVERAISFYALPPFFKHYLLKLAQKSDARKKRLEPYFKTKTHLADVHKKQCSALESTLQHLLPELGPYKCYVGYLWAQPTIDQVVDQMRRDSISRVFVMPQYPHYWCFQSGLCINELGKELRRKTSAVEGRRAYVRYWGSKDEVQKDLATDREPRSVEWSLVDRWPAHPALTDAYSQLITNELAYFPYDIRHEVAILFCAPYPRFYDAPDYRREVAAACLRISEALLHRYPYKIAWFNSWTQWPVPLTGLFNAGQHGLTKTLSTFVHAGRTNVVVVPLPYTAPSIDTEIVLKSLWKNNILRKVGIHHARLVRPPGDDSKFIHGLAEIVKNHYLNESRTSSQFSIRCRRCVWPACYECRRVFATQ